MMDKTFEPTSVEARISAAWAEADAFRAGRPERAGAPPYCIVIPPPNVTGSLHMGHALNNTLQDILCRFERIQLIRMFRSVICQYLFHIPIHANK